MMTVHAFEEGAEDTPLAQFESNFEILYSNNFVQVRKVTSKIDGKNYALKLYD